MTVAVDRRGDGEEPRLLAVRSSIERPGVRGDARRWVPSTVARLRAEAVPLYLWRRPRVESIPSADAAVAKSPPRPGPLTPGKAPAPAVTPAKTPPPGLDINMAR